jgi:hypothetical protein
MWKAQGLGGNGRKRKIRATRTCASSTAICRLHRRCVLKAMSQKREATSAGVACLPCPDEAAFGA